MESYVEVSFIHNLLIHALSLTLSNVLSRKVMSNQRFIGIVLMVSLLPSFLFIEFELWIWIHEMILFLLFFNKRNHTYFIFIGLRFSIHLFYYFMFEGTIYHLQFFVFEIGPVFLFDLFVLVMYLSILMKAKYHISENDFIYSFTLNDKTYKGYVDTGNLATFNNIPIIFIKQSIYEQLCCEFVFVPIQTIREIDDVEGKITHIIMNHKTIKVIICPMNVPYPYDALLNMKGIL